MSRKKNPAAPRAPTRVAISRPTALSVLWRSPWTEVGLTVLVLVVYAQARHFQFVNWDDPGYVTENPMVLGGLTWHSVWWALTTGHSPYWHPVTWLSHLTDVSFFGVEAGGPHLVSVGFHAATTVVVFWALRRLTGRAGPSAAVAAIFAVHPLHVESVAWIAERKDLLSSFFLFVALWGYARYVERPSWARYGFVAVIFALALMAKPMVVTFPVILLLVDYWPLDRKRQSTWTLARWRQLILEKVPFFLMALAVSLVTIGVQAQVGAMATLQTESLGARAARAALSYIEYGWETIWPAGLAAFYPQRPIDPVSVTAAVLTLSLISAAVLVYRRTVPYLTVGWFWYLATLSPVIGFFQAGEQWHADRFMYVPLVGLLVGLVWAVADQPGAAKTGALLSIVVLGVTGMLVPVAYAQTSTWRTSVTLWQHALDVTGSNYKAYEDLGQANRELGHFDEARTDYEKALGAAPSDSPRYAAVLHNDIGLVMVRQGDPREAVDEFTLAERRDPGSVPPHINRANALATIGRLPEALDEFREASRLDPASAEARVGLGNIQLSKDLAPAALSSFAEALRLDPGSADAHNGLGAALLATGDPDRALGEFAEAIRLRPNFPNAEVNLAMALIKVGRREEARRHLETALRLAPNVRGARALLASLGGG
jgi:Flp pilus assembly protein TadD